MRARVCVLQNTFAEGVRAIPADEPDRPRRGSFIGTLVCKRVPFIIRLRRVFDVHSLIPGLILIESNPLSSVVCS